MAYINLGKKRKREYSKKKERNDQNRKLRQKFYQTQEWKNLRLARLYEYPLCEVCLLKGKVNNEEVLTLAEDVHHLRSFTQGRTFGEMEALFYDPDNLCSVCKKCHADIHNGNLKYCESKEEIFERLKFIKKDEDDLNNYLYTKNKN